MITAMPRIAIAVRDFESAVAMFRETFGMPVNDFSDMTVPELGEVWIVGRPSSTAEGAGPAGDLLYRWGNPSTYDRGPAEGKRLFYPHDVQWIPEGYEKAGHLTIFNNGQERPEGEWTSIELIEPPLAADGT